MSSLHDVHVSYADPGITSEDPTLGDALERVFEAQQALVVRRVDLLLEEICVAGAFFVGAWLGGRRA